jgi:hypothetical protein
MAFVPWSSARPSRVCRCRPVSYGLMVVLRADPWSPEYGMGFQAAMEEKPLAADPFVETTDWSAPCSPMPGEAGPMWFVDGVRRVEMRLIAEDDEGRRAAGLFGCFAVGAVRCDGQASFVAEPIVERVVVAGAGIMPERIDLRVAGTAFSFMPATSGGSDPDAPLLELQRLMQQAEASYAREAAEHDRRVVVVDGRLNLLTPTRANVVGMVKRFVRHYLEPEQGALLPRLGPGQRTPLFALGAERTPVDRYAWYTRLVPLRPAWHDQAGIVRCEVRAGLGVVEAVRLADTVTAALPAFAGRRADPRAPQNLAPVGALEDWLRHRMGNARLVRRSLQEWLVARA